jgi:hypothetical protein
MDDLFTQPPWCSDVSGIIYSENGRPGETTVATLQDGAPAELLAAAPELLSAVEDALPCLDELFKTLEPGAFRNGVRDARESVDTAIIRARKGGHPNSTVQQRTWTVNPALPESERKANARLLDAAADLKKAARQAHRYLASHDGYAPVASALSTAFLSSNPNADPSFRS